MKFDETRIQLVRSIETGTPGTFDDDTDWAGTVTAPPDLKSLTSRNPNGRDNTMSLWVGYEVLDDGAPLARGTMSCTLTVVMSCKVAGLERQVIMDAGSQTSAAPNTLYKIDVKPGDLFTVRISSAANEPVTADELRIYARPA
jgi:hypothetical protein